MLAAAKRKVAQQRWKVAQDGLNQLLSTQRVLALHQSINESPVDPQLMMNEPNLPLALLAPGDTFALTMGLFLSSLNTATGLGIGSISLAFAFGQLW